VFRHKLRPLFTIDNRLSPEEAEQILAKALTLYKAGIESETGVGLSFR
jgi:hypothetical protein